MKVRLLMNSSDPLHASTDIGGRRVFVECAGIGQPTVLLEAGLGSDHHAWDRIWPSLTTLTCVCRYDRAGLGQSEPAPRPRTTSEIVSDLHTLLRNAAIPGPYVLVGQSFGGLVVRLYAHRYPADVVGMVLLDAPHEEVWSHYQALLPPATAQENLPLQQLRAFLTRADASKNQEGVDNDACVAQLRATGTLGSLPLVVVSRSQPDSWPSGFPAEAGEAVWRTLQETLARLSSNGQHLIAEHSGHDIVEEQPAIALAAIRQVVTMVGNRNR
jgi:pimeloyl-ACP methyl ester carboxylesterase